MLTPVITGRTSSTPTAGQRRAATAWWSERAPSGARNQPLDTGSNRRARALGCAVPPDLLHASASALLASWTAPDHDQERTRLLLLEHLATHPDGMWRSCADGHLTGSTLVLDAAGMRALFTLHPKIGRWLQMGGHCEEADVDLAATARREAVEESGIDDLVLLPGPVDLDVHALDCPKGRRNRHLDVRWLAVARRCGGQAERGVAPPAMVPAGRPARRRRREHPAPGPTGDGGDHLTPRRDRYAPPS